MNTTSKLWKLSLTFSLMAGLAAALGGCGPAAVPDRGPEVAPSPLQIPLTSRTPAARPEAVDGSTVGTAASPTAQTTSATAKRPGVSATIDYRPETLPSSVPSSIPGAGRAPSVASDSHDMRSSRREGNTRPPTGYLLTDGQGNGVPHGSNAGSPEGYSAGIAGNSGAASVPAQADPVQGQPYTWRDGDRTLTVLLQPDLEVEDGDITVREEPLDTAVTRGSKGDTDKKGSSSSDSSSQPVFRSESGELMTLPGGVLLALEPGWSQTQTDVFFAGNWIEINRVSALGFVTNGFFVETEPGFPSLNLANALAGQDGVVLSSPNWWTEISVVSVE